MKKIVLLLSVFVFVFALNTVAFASTTIVPPELSDNYDSYFIWYEGEHLNAIIYNSSDWTLNVDGTTMKWTKHRDTAYVRYRSSPITLSGWEYAYNNGSTNNGWGIMSQWDHLTHYGCNEIVSSNKTIYDTGGKVVFLVPPPLKEKTEEALTNFQVKTGGMMNTLVLCGVGCLALLMVLKLFGKRLQIFHI